MDGVGTLRQAQTLLASLARAYGPLLARAALRRLRAAAPRLIVATAASAICLSALAIFWPTGRTAPAAPQEPAPAPVIEEWRAVPRPIALFGLEAPELQGVARAYEARRHLSGAREDLIRFGAFDEEEKPFLALRFHRRGAETPLSSSLFLQTARQAGRDGLTVERLAASTDMASKFGPVETADGAVASGEVRRACIAFRAALADGALELSGFACGVEERPMDRALLVCILDRVALLSAGDDRPVRDGFAAAELRRRPACAASRLTATGRRSTWLDPAGQPPPLKGGVSAKGR